MKSLLKPSDTKQRNKLGNIRKFKKQQIDICIWETKFTFVVIRIWWPHIEPESSRTQNHLWVFSSEYSASRCHLTFTTEYIHNVLKTFLPLVTRPCRFDQITRQKIKPRTEGFINHVLMAAILIITQPRPQGLLVKLGSEKTLRERLRSAKTRGEWGPKLQAR